MKKSGFNSVIKYTYGEYIFYNILLNICVRKIFSFQNLRLTIR